MTTLRDRLTTLYFELDAKAAQPTADRTVDAIIEVVSDWISDDPRRYAVYHALTITGTGPPIASIIQALAAEARQ